ncbi:MAG: AAA family ATPase [Verrucomicrobia bacterium]|nr:AAA family ATPase [Verrucomicrobiota bacterium]
MPEVSIDSLRISNFGPYYGDNELRFDELEGRCGVLIGGKNGAGKTHLLRALYLAVVGEAGVVDLKKVETGSDATKFIFENALNRKAEAEGDDTCCFDVTISQRDKNDGGARKLRLVREVRFRPNSPAIWKSTAYRIEGKGVEQVDDESLIYKLRDAFLPRHLARFFFFDAERSQSFNLGQQDIVEGVSRILGLWTYGELEDDLRQLITSKIPKVFDSKTASVASNKLAEVTGRIVTAEGKQKSHSAELKALEIEESEANSEMFDVEERLLTLGAVDPQKMEAARDRRTEITGAKAELESQLRESWEKHLPLMLLGGFRKVLRDYLLTEERRREWEASKSAVEPKIPAVKAEVFENVPATYTLHADFESFYKERLETALKNLFHPAPEGMAAKIFATDRNDTSAQVRAQLMGAVGNVKELVDVSIKLERMESEARELDQQIKNFSQNAAAVAEGGRLHSRRGELTETLKQIRGKKEELLNDLGRLETELSELRREEKLLTEQADKGAKGQNMILLAHRYREAAAEIRSRAAKQLRKKISETVGEIWVEITERSREFKGMEFDDHWKCWLKRVDGKQATWEDTNTSAGQRQVRLLAFYEALRRLAKVVPPLVVDTPLGRLDKEVKNAVLDRLYLTGHQSIILSTNSEIDPRSEQFEVIRGRLGRVYTIHPYGEEGSTDYRVKIKANYFGETP